MNAAAAVNRHGRFVSRTRIIGHLCSHGQQDQRFADDVLSYLRPQHGIMAAHMRSQTARKEQQHAASQKKGSTLPVKVTSTLGFQDARAELPCIITHGLRALMPKLAKAAPAVTASAGGAGRPEQWQQQHRADPTCAAWGCMLPSAASAAGSSWETATPGSVCLTSWAEWQLMSQPAFKSLQLIPFGDVSDVPKAGRGNKSQCDDVVACLYFDLIAGKKVIVLTSDCSWKKALSVLRARGRNDRQRSKSHIVCQGKHGVPAAPNEEGVRVPVALFSGVCIPRPSDLDHTGWAGEARAEHLMLIRTPHFSLNNNQYKMGGVIKQLAAALLVVEHTADDSCTLTYAQAKSAVANVFCSCRFNTHEVSAADAVGEDLD